MQTVLNVNNKPINAEIADNENKRQIGLMHRRSLPWSSGMLFIHESSKYVNYHMKNTNIPLSIAFLDTAGKITEIKHMIPRSREITASSFPVKYALEVNRGWFEENGVKQGDYILGLP